MLGLDASLRNGKPTPGPDYAIRGLLVIYPVISCGVSPASTARPVGRRRRIAREKGRPIGCEALAMGD
jgi:hypothetical protein